MTALSSASCVTVEHADLGCAVAAKGSAQETSTFIEFFAGSGLVAEGLKPYFNAMWANDNCAKKKAVFSANHSTPFHVGDIKQVVGADVPTAALSWASFPCQDLSLAGNMLGLGAERSGLVWQWLRVMDEMTARPPILVAENVVGLVSVDGGAHYRQLHAALVARGYKVGALHLDAVHWLPQSRPRIFVVAVRSDLKTENLETTGRTWAHPDAVVKAADGLEKWVWWKLPRPAVRRTTLDDLVQADAPLPDPETQQQILSLIPETHRLKIADFDHLQTFPGYRRTRNGRQVLEIRFDGVAGCLRTPKGGSSRQTLILRHNGELAARLLTVREAARLMGAPESYQLPGSYNDGYKAMGDAVAVPVAKYLGRWLLHPLQALTA